MKLSRLQASANKFPDRENVGVDIKIMILGIRRSISSLPCRRMAYLTTITPLGIVFRRWARIKLTLVQRLLFTESTVGYLKCKYLTFGK